MSKSSPVAAEELLELIERLTREKRCIIAVAITTALGAESDGKEAQGELNSLLISFLDSKLIRYIDMTDDQRLALSTEARARLIGEMTHEEKTQMRAKSHQEQMDMSSSIGWDGNHTN